MAKTVGPRTRPPRAPLRVALATPALRRCQLAPAAARIVDMATLVVVSVHLFSRGGPEPVALFIAVRTLAPALGTPLVLAASGRPSPGRVLFACASVAAVASAVTAVVVGADGPVVAIVVLGGFTGIALSCLRPLVIALLPGHIAGPSQLLASNSVAALVDSTCTLAGPLLAGAALATAGAAAALWLSAGLLAVTAVAVHGLSRAGIDDGPHQTLRLGTVARAAAEGLRILATDRSLRLVTLLAAGQTFVRGALNVFVVALAIDVLDLGDGGAGFLLATIGVGGLIGLPLAVRFAHARGMGRGLGVALVLWGVPVALAGGSSRPGVAIALFVVIGVGNDLVDITCDTLLQRLVRPDALPVVLGAFDAVLYAGMGLGAAVAAPLVSGVGVGPAMAVVGALLPVLAVVAWRWLQEIDDQVGDRDADVSFLQVHGIFSPLVMSMVDHLAGSMSSEQYGAGQVIVRKGDEGDRYLVIEDGEVEIVDGDVVLAVLGPGEGFGELALLDDAPRNASAIARSPVSVRALQRNDFLAAVRSHGSSQAAVRLVADARRR